MRSVVILLGACVLVSCARESGAPIVATDVRVFAPLPGSAAGVAYLTIENRGDDPVTLQSASSPQFSRVEMHETRIEDGVSRMRPVDKVRIAGGSGVAFEAGGKHLMLMGAKPGALPGSAVTLEIQHDHGLLLVSATMQARLPES